MIHCIGDSHVYVFSGTDVIGGNDSLPFFKTYRLGPHTAYNVIKRREIIEQIIRNEVKRDDIIMFCFGEIDCRTHLLKQAHLQKKSIVSVVNECLDRYFEIFRVAQQYGVPLMAWNVPASSCEEIKQGEYSTYGICQERNHVSQVFNQLLKKRCDESGVIFISIFDKLIDKDGLTNMSYYMDPIHLSQKAMPLILDELRKNKVSFLTAVNTTDNHPETKEVTGKKNKILIYCGINNLLNFNILRPRYDVCYGFDANPAKIEHAREVYKDDPHVHFIFGALTEKSGDMVEFHITNDWDPSSTIGELNPAYVHMRSGKLTSQTKITVPTINLYDFCVDNNIQEIDLLLTDLQGMDLSVLRTMKKFIMKRKIREIQSETETDNTPSIHLNLPSNKLKDFKLLLSDHYDLVAQYPEVVPDDWWEMDTSWRIKQNNWPEQKHIAINIVYEHYPQETKKSLHRGNVSVVWSSLPLAGFDIYAYMNASSFRGKQSGLDVLIMLEPIVVLPGEYSEEVWKHFDHVFSLCDSLSQYGDKFTKILFPRSDWTSGWIRQSAVTEDLGERRRKYPLKDRIDGICMINGHKQSSIAHELYSKRNSIAGWFSENSDIPFDVFGHPPFNLPNYKGALVSDTKLETLRRYKYSLCFENTNHPEYSAGYISEKILDCLETRTLPIYLGCANIEKYVPPECYIDFRKFSSYADLNDFLHHLSDTAYETYIQNIDGWVTHGGLRPYTWHAIYDQLIRLYAASANRDMNDLLTPQTQWIDGISPSCTIEKFIPVDSSPLWRWRDLACGTSPLLTGTGDAQRPSSKEYILSFQNFKSDQGSLRIELLAEIATVFGLTTFIETGTYLGNTSYAASKIFASVHTIELSAELYQKAVDRFQNHTGIRVYHGDSGDIFPQLLPNINGRALFWLDGHYSEGFTAKGDENTPIIKEIKAIREAGITDAVILIDDLRFFDNVWDIVPGNSAARGYPSVVTLCKAIHEIDKTYNFAVVGDILMAYPAVAGFGVSPVVAACTVSRLYDGNNFSLKEVMEADATIGRAEGAELFALQNLFNTCRSTESYGLGKHYRLWHALILAAHEDFMTACKEFLIAMNLGFDHWRINWYLAKTASLAGYFTLAIEQIKIVLAANPACTEAKQLLKQIEKNKKKNRKESIFSSQDRIELALHYQNAAKLEAAMNELDAAIQHDPNNPDTHYCYAKLCLTANQYKKAIIILQKVLTLKADYSPAHNDLGEIYKIMGDSKKALEHFKKAVSLEGKYYSAISNLLNILIQDRSFDEAANILKSLLENSPEDANLMKIAEQFIAIAKKGGIMPDISEITDAKQDLIPGPNHDQAVKKNAPMQKLPQNVEVMEGTRISTDCQIGDYTYIGYNCSITKATIGRYCSIANNVSIGQGEHDINRISTSSLFYDNPYQELTRQSCIIGHDVWIGVDAIVKRGVTIGDGAVVGANSFVNSDVPAFAIVAGSPAKMVKYRFPQQKIAEILKSNWWNEELQDAKRIIRRLEANARKEAPQENETLSLTGNKQTTAIAFSKDRAMQLDCVLQSLMLHCKDIDSVNIRVLYTTSSPAYENQYQNLKADYPSVEFIRERDFKSNLVSSVEASEYILFLVDDNIFVCDFILGQAIDSLKNNADCLGFSLRLGSNTDYCYMLKQRQIIPAFTPFAYKINSHEWITAECDFGYPLEVSSSLYRTEDLLPLLAHLDYQNPNTLELVLDTNKNIFRENKKYLLSFEKSVTFCNPVNMVQNMWKNRAGDHAGYSPEKLAQMYDEGYRIDVKRYSGLIPASCHQEEKLQFVRNTAAPLVSIVILHQNGLDNIRLNLESIRKYTPETYEIIVFDNGSTDGSNTYLRSQNDIILIESSQNIGCTPARAKAMSIAQGQYLVLLDNDTIVTPGWTTKFIEHARKKPHIGMMGPCSNYASGPQLVTKTTYKSEAELEVFAGKWSEQHRGELVSTFRLVGFCMFIRKELFEKIGIIDESLGFFGFDDDDYTLRAHIAGFNPSIARDIFIHHTGGPQGRGDQKVNQSLLDAWESYKKKWKIAPEIPYGTSYNIGPIIAQPFDQRKHYCRPYPFPVIREMIYSHESSSQTEGIPSFPQAKFMNNLTSIIIPVQSDHVKECVSSIKKYTHKPYEIIFADQNAVQGTKKWMMNAVKENNNYRIVKNDEKAGFIKALNRTITESHGEYIVCLSDDVVVFEGWLSDMLTCLHSDKNMGIVGPMTDRAFGVQKTEGIDNTLQKYRMAFQKRNRHRRVPVHALEMFCLLFHRELAKTIGLFDENLTSPSSACEDFCLRASLEGQNSVIAGDVFVSRISKGSDWCDRKPFLSKWGIVDTGNDQGKKFAAVRAMELAAEKMDHDLIDEAIHEIMDGISKAPHETRLYFFLAEILIGLNRFADALAALNTLPEDAANDIKALELAAFAREGLNLDAEAGELADRILSSSEDHAAALNLKGMRSRKQGEIDRAVIFFEKAIKSDPGYGSSYTNLGDLKWMAGQQAEALPLLEKGFILSPLANSNISAYHSAVCIMEEFDRSLLAFREAQSLYPRNKRISFLQIDLLIKKNDFPSAMLEIEKAIVTFGIDDDILEAAMAVRAQIGAKEIARDKKHPETLTVCMIVKNEEQHLVRCMKSIKPIADEIIIVDTGSTDRTKKIAIAFGAKVYDFAWNNNFADARNFSIEQAKSNWILVHDADEVLSPLDYHNLKGLLHKTKSQPTAFSMITRNYSNNYPEGWTANDGRYPDEEAGLGWHPTNKVRLFINDRRIRFEGHVHEVVEPSLIRNGMKFLPCSIPIHHYGRLNVEKTNTKSEEYYILGEKKLAVTGDNPRALRELAIQAGELGKHKEAINFWQRLVNLDKTPEILTLAFFNMASCYFLLGKYEEALATSQKAMELDSGLKENKITYACSELCAGDTNKAIPVLVDLLQKSPGYPLALSALTVAYFVNGNKKDGLACMDRLREIRVGVTDYLHDFAGFFIKANRIDQAITLLEASIENNVVHADTNRLLANCREKLAMYRPSSINA